MARQPLDVREWLEDMRRFNGRDADRATEILDQLDQAEASEAILCKIIAGEKTDDPETDEIVERLAKLEALEAWAERDPTFNQFGALDVDGLSTFVKAYEALEAESFELQALCVEAGLLSRNDHTTNPLPLLRMFLPVD